MKNNYQFSDLFDADYNQTSLGKKQREKVNVGQLERLENLYPKK